MQWLAFVTAWLAGRFNRDERGQGSVEYVLLILAVVLFLIAAAFGLKGILSSAISSIGSWVGTLTAP